MKTLYVLRHGKAAPEVRSEPDYDRALTSHGEAEAKQSAHELGQRPNAPSLILSSKAVRARQTAEACAKRLPGVGLVLLDELYLAEPNSYLAALAARAEPHASVLVVGHNPGLEELVQLLGKRSEHLATASLVEIELPIAGWTDLFGPGGGEPRAGRIKSVFRP
jgi:phosphohistidine phosphatase